MRYNLFFILMIFSLAASSQRVVDVDKSDAPISTIFYAVGGEPVSNVKYVRVVEGSPYFSENWLAGSLIVSGGRKYDLVLLRLDLIAGELQYLDADGNELIATTPVTEVWLNDTNQARFHFLNAAFLPKPSEGAPVKGWLQVLTESPNVLLKEHYKQTNEITAYNTAVHEQTISTKYRYYVLAGGKLNPVKKIGEIPELFPAHKGDLEKYIKNNHLSSKSDADYVNLLSYLNSITPK